MWSVHFKAKVLRRSFPILLTFSIVTYINLGFKDKLIWPLLNCLLKMIIIRYSEEKDIWNTLRKHLLRERSPKPRAVVHYLFGMRRDCALSCMQTAQLAQVELHMCTRALARHSYSLIPLSPPQPGCQTAKVGDYG